MNANHRMIAARVLAVLAVVSLPAFVWLGWWQLVVSVLLGVAAVVVTPRGEHKRHPDRRSSLFRTIQQRLHPHSWRPGRR